MHSIFVGRFLALSIGLLGFIPSGITVRAEPALKKLVLLLGEDEYETERTLPAFAAGHLKEYRVVVVSAGREVTNSVFDKMEEVADADVLLVSVRRRLPPQWQMDIVRRYVSAGKAVVGIRTASHAFARGRNGQPEGGTEWPDWDRVVIGGNYSGHYPRGPVSRMTAAVRDSPLLTNVALPFESGAWLYKVQPLAARAQAVLQATVEGGGAEPVAWTFTRADGGRTFYTSLGMPSDFTNPSFVTLLRNGIQWAAAGPPRVTEVSPPGAPPDRAIERVARETNVALLGCATSTSTPAAGRPRSSPANEPAMKLGDRPRGFFAQAAP